jgi:hypothetical protein
MSVSMQTAIRLRDLNTMTDDLPKQFHKLKSARGQHMQRQRELHDLNKELDLQMGLIFEQFHGLVRGKTVIRYYAGLTTILAVYAGLDPHHAPFSLGQTESIQVFKTKKDGSPAKLVRSVHSSWKVER